MSKNLYKLKIDLETIYNNLPSEFKNKTANHQEKIMNLINLIDHCHNVFKTKKQINEAKRCIVYYVYGQILLIYNELLQREKIMRDKKEDLFEQEEETKILNNIQNILAAIKIKIDNGSIPKTPKFNRNTEELFLLHKNFLENSSINSRDKKINSLLNNMFIQGNFFSKLTRKKNFESYSYCNNFTDAHIVKENCLKSKQNVSFTNQVRRCNNMAIKTQLLNIGCMISTQFREKKYSSSIITFIKDLLKINKHPTIQLYGQKFINIQQKWTRSFKKNSSKTNSKSKHAKHYLTNKAYELHLANTQVLKSINSKIEGEPTLGNLGLDNNPSTNLS